MAEQTPSIIATEGAQAVMRDQGVTGISFHRQAFDRVIELIGYERSDVNNLVLALDTYNDRLGRPLRYKPEQDYSYVLQPDGTSVPLSESEAAPRFFTRDNDQSVRISAQPVPKNLSEGALSWAAMSTLLGPHRIGKRFATYLGGGIGVGIGLTPLGFGIGFGGLTGEEAAAAATGGAAVGLFVGFAAGVGDHIMQSRRRTHLEKQARELRPFVIHRDTQQSTL